MTISVITISFNSEKTIFDTLKSVQNQTYLDYEHIIIDGNSTDDTILICKKFSHISKIICEPDKGIYYAFNKGIKIARGKIIGFLNSDDIFHDNNVLSVIAKNFNDNVECVFGNLNYFNSYGRLVRKWRSSEYKKGLFSKSWMPAHPTFYCKREIYEKFGYYNEEFSIAGDFELMLRFIEKFNIKSKFIDKTLVNMLTGGISNGTFLSKIKIIDEELKAFKINDIKVNPFLYLLYKAAKLKEFL